MTTAKTILFLHPSAELYGADRTLLQLVEGLDAERWKAVVLLPRRGVLAGQLERLGALIEVGELGLGERASLDLSGILKLAYRVPLGALRVWRSIRRHRPSVVHTNTMVVLGGAIGARLSGVPHLWHVHEILEQPLWLARVYARLFSALAERVICNSEATRESFCRFSTHLTRNSDVVMNAVAAAPDLSDDVREATRKRLGLSPGQSLVLLAGRVNSWKGQTLLVQAAAQLRQRFPDTKYLIVGSAPAGQEHFEEALDEQIEQLGMESQVIRMAFCPDLSEIYHAADICCVPSTRPEPFGLVAAEAMAAARAVVASNAGGLAEIVEEGITGRLFTPGSVDELASALGDLMQDQDLAQRMGQAGLQRQQALFDLRRYCDQFDEHYRSLANVALMEPMPAETRVIHLVLGKANPDRLNGVNRAVHSLAVAQVEAGRRVEVWGLTPTPEAPAGERPYALRLFRRCALRGWLPADLRAAMTHLESPTIVHLHGGLLPEMAAAALFLGRTRVPFVFTPHGAYNPQALAKRRWLKWLCMGVVDRAILSRARGVQAFTAAEARATARWVSFERIAIVPNGQAQVMDATRAGDSHGRLQFGFCGRLDVHTKGLDLLLDGFGQFLQQGGDAELILIGDGPGRDELETRAAQSDLAGHVTFRGALFGAEKQDLLASLWAFVHPSRHEGMPMAVLEAAALGLPLMVSEGTNLASVVQAYEAGPELVTNDVAGIATCLGTLANATTVQRRTWSSNACSMVSDCFAWDRIEPLAARTLYDLDTAPLAPSLTPVVEVSS